MSVVRTPPSRMSTVSENSKSLMSPSTTTFAFGSAARITSTKSFTTCACWCRATSVCLTGGWKRPKSGSSPPLELKWFTTAKIFLPRARSSRASDLRVSTKAGLPGSMRPGLAESRGPEGWSITVVLVVEGIDLAVVVGRAAGRLDRGDERLPRDRRVRRAAVGLPVVVLHLLDRDQVGRAEMVDDQVRVAGKGGAVTRVEILDVVRPDD